MNMERMDGQVVVITGGSSGVGLAVGKGLARLGARTVLISRREQNARHAVDEVRRASGNDAVEFAIGDLTDLVAVKALVSDLERRLPRIDALVSAAGTVGERGVTASGIPRSFATNYLGHFSLIRAALPLLNRAPHGRILVVGAAPALVKQLRAVNYDAVTPEASAAALLTQSLAWKLLLAHHLAVTHPEGPPMTVFHPGLIRSNLLNDLALPLRLVGTVSNLFAKDHCAVAEDLASATPVAGVSGQMVDDHGRRVQLPALVTTEHAARVWRASVAMTER
ncbi:SDR family NAD(P)-dependent oxidoreductase [Deinococcus altitudinis]|uniref:SDR family NAD(P)-dependent oxidoreductase n=1 Tax=Deinococcus altitudinis TaxID=468914 RepID=UPI003892B794